MLRGRRNECAVLDGLLDAARAGRSGVLVVRGEAGVGKTALLEYAVESAPELQVVRAVGVESEMELAFAALHQLCAPILDRLERLPGPQRAALAMTFGLREGAAPDRFLVGLATLSLLAEAAEEVALVCVIDDAQWLDEASAQTLAFVARRLLAESVVMIVASRRPGENLRGLPELVVEGLRDDDARELLASAIRWPLDDRVGERIVAESRGNPLALLELPRGLSPEQLAGGFGLPGAVSVVGRIEERFLQRLEALPQETQRLLLLAAAEPTGDPVLLWRAARLMGIAGSVLGPAEGGGLVEVGTGVRFRHPLVRSAVYRAASLEQRRDAHRALAEATDAAVDPDRRAWHLAAAAAGLDEEVALELERAADRALAAAQTKLQAGAVDAVQPLLATAEAGPLSELQQARANRVRAELAYVTSRGNAAAPLLLDAAERLEPIAPDLARATYLDAFMAANFAGRLAAPGGSLLDVARAATAAPAHPVSPTDLFVDGQAANIARGYAAGLPILRSALKSFGAGIPADQELRGMLVAWASALHIWDDDGFDRLSARWASLCREAGALSDLLVAINARAVALLFKGDLAGVELLVEEGQAATEATGLYFGPYGAMGLAALRGDEGRALALIDASNRDALPRGEGGLVSAAEWANALLNNGLGRYPQALTAAGRASEGHEEMAFANWSLPELIEAAVRTGQSDTAVDALRRLAEMTGASATDWARGVEARSRALLGDGAVAESLYREAIERLGRTRVRVELARAHLLYGEWLRRERRRLDAREQLRTAHEMLSTMGVHAFARRAERELLATGERAHQPAVVKGEELTSQELHIARLARDGVSNPEIAARLFISRRTVEYHLGKVFTKLNIRSRHELDRALPAQLTAPLAS